MKTRYIQLASVLLSASLLSLTSCKKEGCIDETAINYDAEAKKDDGSCEYEEVVTATITISSPEMHKSYDLGETIEIQAMIEASAEIHGYQVILTNKTSGEHIMHLEEHAHDLTTHIHEEWVNDVTAMSDMQLEIKAILDHEGTEESMIVEFHCHNM